MSATTPTGGGSGLPPLPGAAAILRKFRGKASRSISELTSSLHGIEAELRRLLDRRGQVEAEALVHRLRVECRLIGVEKECSSELAAVQKAIAREVSKRLMKRAMKRAMTATEAEVGQAMKDLQGDKGPQPM